jgi:hypothetical protein
MAQQPSAQRSSQKPGTANAECNALGVCEFGPDGCDPQAGDDSLCCKVCGKYVCDYHGDYPTDQHYADGDWRCPDCKDVE